MMFFLEEYCVVDGNKCEPGEIYCCEKCKEMDSISLTIPNLEESTSSSMSNDSIYSTSPLFSMDDDDILQTPNCDHHFMYDSKFLWLDHNQSNCDCQNKKMINHQHNSYNQKDDGRFVDINFNLNSSYQMKHEQEEPIDSDNNCLSSMMLDDILNTTSFFEKEIQENKQIKNSFKTAKDNYRLWLNVNK